MIYFVFIVPFLVAGVLLIFWQKRVVWWELVIPIVVSVALILIAKQICISSLTADEEYLGGYVKSAHYYEDWNERVSCRHPIYCTSCTGSGKTRSCHTYVCGHHHPYDVDYHPPKWIANTTLDNITITESKYNALVKQFQVTPVFKDLHRSYHTNDGDMYFADWRGDDDGLEPVVKTHGYENRPKAAVNVYHFDPPDSVDMRMYGLYAYPLVESPFRQRLILWYDDPVAEKKLQVLNARLGSPKQLRVFICVFRDKSREAALKQEDYWEGGNKNEFVICVGVDKSDKVQWAADFSWTEREECKVETRAFIEKQGILDLAAIVDYTYQELQTKFVRKNFSDFDYLNIEPTMKQVVWIFIITAIVNVGMAVWIVKNDWE